MNTKKVAVILAGCGVFDGSEIQEAVATLLAIDKAGAVYQCFAPDTDQYHVINHLTGEEEPAARNVLAESARIARGDVKQLDTFEPSDFDVLIIPGGFGVAKNLCTFAIDGPGCSVNPETEKAIKRAHDAGIPIGALCISPALMARVLGEVTLTIGSDAGTAQAIESMGATHKNTAGDEIVVDAKNKIVTTPCYMLDSKISTVFRGAENAVNALLEML
ncbi:MAG: isoprenoid biosynthesis glyoxalase ElbB [Prolixibacteraceae bacterium]|nr:isoprenoid biosynthesis glyoxalase ElbB [Prolixibacteraceae bacterium]